MSIHAFASGFARLPSSGMDPHDTAEITSTEPPKDPLLPPQVPPPHHTEETHACRPDMTPPWKILLETAAVFIGVYVAWVYSGQLDQMVESNKKTQASLEISQKQLEATERPWLKLTFTAAPITFQQGGMQLGVQPHILNVGHSVATGVIVPIKIFLASSADDMFKEPLKRQKALCDPLLNKPVSGEQDEKQIAIFPDSTDESLLLGSGFSKSEIDSAPTANPNFSVKHLVPIMVGCVDYQYGTSTHHHQTRFIYEFFRSGATPNTTIEVGEDVSMGQVRLTPYPFGGFLAN